MTGWEVDPARLLDESAARNAGAGGSLARTLLGALNPDGSQPVVVRQGSVVSFSQTTWQATVTVSGDTTQVPGTPHLQDYPLQAGDPVWLVKYGPGYMVVGSPTAAKRQGDLSGPRYISSQESSNRVAYNGTGWYVPTGTWTRGFESGTVSIPSNTRLVQIGFDCTARASANAACFWRMGIDGLGVIGPANWRRHNFADAVVPLGAAFTQWWAPTSTSFNVYVDINNDAASAGGISLYIGNFQVHCFA